MSRTLLLGLTGFMTLGVAASALAEEARPTESAAPAPIQYGDWLLRCLELPNALPCDVVQSLEQKETKALVMAISVSYSPRDGKQPVQISVPLGVDLRRGVDISVGNVMVQRVRPSRCEHSGCIIEAILGEDVLGAMRASDKGKLILAAEAGAETTIEFSLKGFKHAEAAMKKETLARQQPGLAADQ